jgi:hypothetical protein
MKSSIKKAVSGRTMRVATTFTGVAACAFAFAPTAMATTAHQPQIKDNTIGPLNTVNGSCGGANQSHWFHMGTTATVTCYGNIGTANAGGYVINSFCGGNNIGYFSGKGSKGKKKVTFGTGDFWAHVPSAPFAVSKVHISNWTGGTKCPEFP